MVAAERRRDREDIRTAVPARASGVGVTLRRLTPTWDIYDGELVATGLVPVDSALLAQVRRRV